MLRQSLEALHPYIEGQFPNFSSVLNGPQRSERERREQGKPQSLKVIVGFEVDGFHIIDELFWKRLARRASGHVSCRLYGRIQFREVV